MLFSYSKQILVVKNRLLLLVAIFSSLLMSCSSSSSKFNIIFSAKLDGNQDLYQAIGPDFQSVERLTFTPEDRESSLFLSKDGKKLIYSSTAKSEPPTILDLASKSLVKIENSPFIPPKGWMPDGKEVILGKKSGELFTATLDGKFARALPITPLVRGSTFNDLSFSPDGKLMVYMDNHFMSPPSSPHSPLNSPILYDFEKNEVISKLDTAAAICNSLSWSPLEWKILITCNLDFNDVNPDWHIYLFEVPQNAPENFKKIADIKNGRYTLWSPTGERFVAYYRVGDIGKWGIFDKDGSYEGEILPAEDEDTPTGVRIVAWSPDGKQIVYTAGTDVNELQIYIVNIDGTNNRLITKQPSNYNWIQTYPLVQ
jgi:Tol biopolymer transport system component